MHSEDILFDYGGEKLAGTFDWNDAKDKPTVLALCGSRPGNRQTIAHFTTELAAHGHSCFRFDYVGHGDSTGFYDATVNELIEQAAAGLPFLDHDKNLTLIGSSLGGHLALGILQRANFKNLILFCPSAYSVEASNAPYDVRSRWPLETIVEAPIFANLEAFHGNLLHVIGAEDTVIPPNVTALYKKHSTHLASEFVTVPEAPHRLNKWLEDHPAERREVFDKMLVLVRNT